MKKSASKDVKTEVGSLAQLVVPLNLPPFCGQFEYAARP